MELNGNIGKLCEGEKILIQASYNSQFRLRMYKPTINTWAREAMHSPANEGLIYGINSYYIFKKPKIEIPMQGNALTCVIQETL